MIDKSHFLLNEEITFLNFGSFGSCPRDIFKVYQNYQEELERDPVQFITFKGQKYLQESRNRLGAYIHCDPDDLIMVVNPSYAINTIAKTFSLSPGDEVLTTDLEYGACDRTWKVVCGLSGARYVRQKINLPIQDADTIVEELFAGVTSKTKLIFVSHITSTTALILPVKKIVERAKTLGIPVFVDGAHAPGHISLDIQDIDADFYTGACHKWMMTPKGSSFMYVRKDKQQDVLPLVVSWGYDALFPSHSTYQDWHTVSGTRDFSAFLCVPASIEFMDKHKWPTVKEKCRLLVKDNAEEFCKVLNTNLLSPLDDDYIGQMLSVPIKTGEPEKLYRTFVDDYKIEIPVMRHDDKVFLRYSIHAFNDQNDINTLFEAIKNIKQKTTLIL
jgi:isopenicillin-N epimerase